VKPKAYSYLRMSTDLQLKGDSRRRQLEASIAYAEAEGLELADDARLEDIGVSAFKGANLQNGALGQFLTAVKAGSVERGSYLLVESLDRLSREEILRAHTLFLSIVQAGINLVTLADKRVYGAKTTNLVDMITSLVIMERAHEESKTKSMRVGAAWKNKRAKAAEGQPMTARCPAWLRLSADRSGYEIISDRAELVRQIFADAVVGIGMYSIANRLNRARIPAFVGKNGWHQSYIAKTLANRAVIGEFQAHIKLNGARVPSEDPIKNYFPQIIDNELFYRAQQSKHERRSSKGNGAGRKGLNYSNLFSGLAQCAYCGCSIGFENKGSGTKGGTYLICDGAKRQRGCSAVRWRYKDFEASFLAFVEEIDLETMINQDEEAERRRTLEAEISALKGELPSIGMLMQQSFALLETGAAVDFVSGKLRELEARENQVKQGLKSKQERLDALNGKISSFYESKEEVRQFVQRLQQPSGNELYKLRAGIAARLKSLVETLLLAPLGNRPKTQKVLDLLRCESGAEDVAQHIEGQLADPRSSRPYFALGFRNGNVRAVYPNQKDPLQYHHQVVANGDIRVFGHSGQELFFSWEE
jgi:DNA invertase Pin-like site-specific DNA recombinase